MSQPYVGQILIFGGNFAPVGWAFCSGQLMSIADNDALFQLIGTTYGGDGEQTFALPDLQGRAPMHMGQGPGVSQNYIIGEAAGVESVTLTQQQIPTHNHLVQVRTGVAGNTSAPSNSSVLADEFQSQANAAFVYAANNGLNQVTLASQTIAPSGGSQPHENRQLFLTLNFIISLFGVFPSQN
jgi:microcystin-dependent protein